MEIVRNVPLLLQLFYWYFAVLRPLPNPRQSLNFFDIAFLNKRGLFLPYPVFEPGFARSRWTIAGDDRRRPRARMAERGATARAPAAALHSLRRHRAAAAAAAARCRVAHRFSAQHGTCPRLAGFNFAGGMTVIPEFVAMAIALSLYGAAYIAEIVRSGIRAVPAGQIDAARAVGLQAPARSTASS